MDSVMKGLFGGGKFESEEKANQAKDFVNRYEEGDPTEGFSREEAVEHYREVAKGASPETMQRATKKAVERLSPSQREDFAKMLKERQQGQVERREGDAGGGAGLDDLLGSLMGGGGQAGGGGIGDLFGSLMGGGDTDRDRDRDPRTTQATAGGGGGGFDIGDIMGSNVGKAVLGGIAAYAMKEILDNK